ncbi:hypothetical protein LshimejAT787_0500260 [Lyophyllum shimeji]|uniref:Uncharacterized protein n=1 Tax=Lyophyllum shimeji TaxID=47721 RepID=A0A9P3PMR9_LYOSH|nr:hypothetical protein LshimejAT787_0500260 [Lyophyllum shimeji]
MSSGYRTCQPPVPVSHPPKYQHAGSEPTNATWASIASSPATSSSTLVSDDEEMKSIFDAEKNPLPETELNPHAAPFIPQLPPKSRRLVRPTTGTMLRPRMPKWRRIFDLAIRAPIDEKDAQLHSLIIVGAESWDPEPMAELAQEFCWRFAEALPEDLDAVLHFMLRLHSQFTTMKSQEVGESFEWHLKEFILGTFISVWDAKNNPEALSYDFVPSPQYTKSAIQLAGVIGALYARRFFDSKNISDCLETLIANFVSVEHADALAALVHRAGPSYWFHHPDGPVHLHRFGTAFTTVAQKLRGEMSLLGLPRSNEEVHRLLRSVDTCCREWYAQMAVTMQTPRPAT